MIFGICHLFSKRSITSISTSTFQRGKPQYNSIYRNFHRHYLNPTKQYNALTTRNYIQYSVPPNPPKKTFKSILLTLVAIAVLPIAYFAFDHYRRLSKLPPAVRVHCREMLRAKLKGDIGNALNSGKLALEEAKKLPDTLAMNLIVGEIIASLHKTVINGKDKEKAAELVRIVIPEWLRCLADDNTHLAVFFSHLIGDLFQNGLKDLTSARIFSEWNVKSMMSYNENPLVVLKQIPDIEHILDLNSITESFEDAFTSREQRLLSDNGVRDALGVTTSGKEFPLAAWCTKEEMGISLLSLGSIYQQEKNYESAIIVSLRALELLKKKDAANADLHIYSYIANILSSVYFELNKIREAKFWGQKALIYNGEAKERVGDEKYVRCTYLLNMGKIVEYEKDYTKAKMYYSEAKEEGERTGFNHCVLQSIGFIKRLNQVMGKAKSMEDPFSQPNHRILEDHDRSNNY